MDGPHSPQPKPAPSRIQCEEYEVKDCEIPPHLHLVAAMVMNHVRELVAYCYHTRDDDGFTLL